MVAGASLARAHKCWWEPPTSTLLYSKSKISILLECLGAAFVGFAARNLSLPACGQLVLSERRVGRGPASRQIAV